MYKAVYTSKFYLNAYQHTNVSTCPTAWAPDNSKITLDLLNDITLLKYSFLTINNLEL